MDLICSQLDVRQNLITGRYVGRDCSGKEKAKRVRAKYDFASFENVFAYGDTIEDKEMLAPANIKYFRAAEKK